MKKTLLRAIHFFALLIAFVSCKDHCQETNTYRGTESVLISLNELRNSVKALPAQDLVNPGKIYVKDNYLFINEIKKGFHVIDNSNPASPKAIAFIQVLGNIDIAVQDNILYADSYTDFVAFDISNPTAIKEVSRVNEVFTYGVADGISWSYNANNQTIYDYKWKWYTTTQEVSCDPSYYPIAYYDSWSLYSSFSSSSSTGSVAKGAGVGGSTARFTIANNHLYAVTQDEMKLFSLANPEKPTKDASIKLGFGIETIFPYKNKLFLGTTTGMQIWNNENPSNPTFLSRLDHVRACDPVVVEDDIAYVTLRSVNNFSRCGAAIANQLDVINVSNPATPVLLKSYNMDSPYGLGIDNKKLFICEGKGGLKTFNATNSMDIKLIQHFTDMNTYDVIPLNGTLMLIGKDGLYQYDYKDANNLKLLSKILVKREN
ncbi:MULTISPECIES: hypothetical protein [unclassified Arcicella]|uniref:LVIVD repeat-containing protein n=1 Tax=unclassified Arcicella TaxID=2644986 RepID=UPI00285754DF|nr:MULTISPECIES: hypothetical protein [unclassified Arcicella]MDR6564146.1 hypothetical protein [Arcicella sp. BE51]MDR6813899.1 hypothetical protein [Arcicella sp. BE140]MDR6825211.1 hypothetical protein [Arcicella sp. BE139]